MHVAFARIGHRAQLGGEHPDPAGGEVGDDRGRSDRPGRVCSGTPAPRSASAASIGRQHRGGTGKPIRRERRFAVTTQKTALHRAGDGVSSRSARPRGAWHIGDGRADRALPAGSAASDRSGRRSSRRPVCPTARRRGRRRRGRRAGAAPRRWWRRATGDVGARDGHGTDLAQQFDRHRQRHPQHHGPRASPRSHGEGAWRTTRLRAPGQNARDQPARAVRHGVQASMVRHEPTRTPTDPWLRPWPRAGR